MTLPKAPVVGHNTSGDIFLYAYTTVYSRTRTIVFDLTDEGNLELVKPIVGLIKMLSSGTTSYKPAIYSDGKLMKANATNTVTIASKMSDNTGETSVKPVRITFDGDSGVVYGLTTSKTCTYQKFAIAANDSVTFCQDQASAYSTDTYYSLVMTAVAYGSSWKYIADPEGKMGLAPVKGKLDRKAGTLTIDPWTVYAQKVDGTGYTYNVNYPAISSVIKFDPQIATSVKDTEVADDENVAPVYYNLQGIRVANPENGIFIEVRGKKATKVIK